MASSIVRTGSTLLLVMVAATAPIKTGSVNPAVARRRSTVAHMAHVGPMVIARVRVVHTLGASATILTRALTSTVAMAFVKRLGGGREPLQTAYAPRISLATGAKRLRRARRTVAPRVCARLNLGTITIIKCAIVSLDTLG